MARQRKPRDDYDGAWKEVIESYLREFLDFFFPAASAGLDWARGYRFLDKELQKLTPRGALRKPCAGRKATSLARATKAHPARRFAQGRSG